MNTNFVDGSYILVPLIVHGLSNSTHQIHHSGEKHQTLLILDTNM